tara:strand:+ start:13926 stop:15320 length:1395 start_codon:yes stop_codon:yes gene_type:complete
MSAVLEIKYFNSFWLKRMKNLTDDSNPVDQPVFNDTEQVANLPKDYIVGTTKYPVNTTSEDWFIEEARIRGGYNNTSVDFGVKAYLVEDDNVQQHRFNSMIYSGVFNSRTGVNNTNVFSVADDITKSVNPSNASIQKLYAEDTNLIIFQEDKVSKALIDKDAIYSAEGNSAITSTRMVIGQIVPFGGVYGISTDPESFAVYGYRKYFSDRKRNAVLRLSVDGITEISNYGMQDFFRDNLGGLSSTGSIIGGWDIHNKNYVISLKEEGNYQEGSYNTLSFDDSVNGWTSFYSYNPDFLIGLNTDLYSVNLGKIYKHYTLDPVFSENRSVFYGVRNDSYVTFVFNKNVSSVKTFKTINYEGSDEWELESMDTSTDSTLPISKYAGSQVNLMNIQNQLFINNFKKKENKYFANVINNTLSQPGEVVWGGDSSGVKGFFATVKMKLDKSVAGKKELFAVSTNFVESSY